MSFKVQAYKLVDGEKIYGDWSNLKIIKEQSLDDINIDIPTGIGFNDNGDTMDFYWDSVDNATNYEILLFISDLSSMTMNRHLTDTTYTHKVGEMKNVKFKVRAYYYVNGKVKYGDWSDLIIARPSEQQEDIKLNKVEGLDFIDDGGDNIIFTWDEVSNADGYKVTIYNDAYDNVGAPNDSRYNTAEYHGFNGSKNVSFKVKAYKTVNGKTYYGEESDLKIVRPLEVDGVVTNLSATDIIRENDAYNGYAGNAGVSGTMSRADSVMALVKALSQAAVDPEKKSTMVQTALKEYSNGNIVMQPEGSFTKLLATKGFESIM